MVMSAPEERYLAWDRQLRIPLPTQTSDEYMLVRKSEIKRLRKRVEEELSPSHENLSTSCYSLFGAALAMAAAIPPLLTAKGLPNWITPTFIVSACAFFALGLVLVFITHTLRSGTRRAASEIAQEMREIEESNRGLDKPDSGARNRQNSTQEP